MSASASGHHCEIPREPATIGFEEFRRKYFDPEQPCIIEGVSDGWPAAEKWSGDYLKDALADDPKAVVEAVWFNAEKGVLPDDYTTPPVIEQVYREEGIHTRPRNIRIWVHRKGHETNMHYDGLDLIFNLQMKGTKDWILIPPDQPLKFYPFTNFSPIGDDEHHVAGKTYMQFRLKAGEMLFLPPFWQHRVVSCDEENINLAWEFAKSESDVTSAIQDREEFRYQVYKYFTEHRFGIVRRVYQWIYDQVPPYITLVYGGYPHFLSNMRKRSVFAYVGWILGEWGRLPRVLWDMRKIRLNLKRITAPKVADQAGS